MFECRLLYGYVPLSVCVKGGLRHSGVRNTFPMHASTSSSIAASTYDAAFIPVDLRFSPSGASSLPSGKHRPRRLAISSELYRPCSEALRCAHGVPFGDIGWNVVQHGICQRCQRRGRPPLSKRWRILSV